MSELRLVWNPTVGEADLQLVNGQPDLSQALETWIVVSLFSDRLAQPGDPVIPAPDGTIDLRGCWGDTYLAADFPGYVGRGSRLWLLERSKSWPQLPQIARGYILEALQWMIDDGVASVIDAQCFFQNNDTSRLIAIVSVTHVSGQAFNYRYDDAWLEQLALAA